ncbi:MAG: methyltransferase domain-containing protein, partial [Nanoarchaeota archaeon]
WQAINAGNFKHRVLDELEQQETQLQVAKYLATGILSSVSDDSVYKDRLALWDRCYGESAILPPFLVKPVNQPVRLNGRYVMPESQLFEADFLAVVRAYLFDKYFTNLNTVAEFGCGTGHNLLSLAKQQPGKVVFGLDWSKQALEHVRKMTQQGVNAHAVEFDLLNPAPQCSYYNLRHIGVLTVGALEQVGKRFDEFLCFLLSRRPPIIVHLEPIIELYDENDPFDQLAIHYQQARGYLEGYLPAVQRLARYGLAEILEVHRIPFGSFYHEAYTIIVWRPTL